MATPFPVVNDRVDGGGANGADGGVPNPLVSIIIDQPPNHKLPKKRKIPCRKQHSPEGCLLERNPDMCPFLHVPRDEYIDWLKKDKLRKKQRRKKTSLNLGHFFKLRILVARLNRKLIEITPPPRRQHKPIKPKAPTTTPPTDDGQ